jgi:hypothetical protein
MKFSPKYVIIGIVIAIIIAAIFLYIYKHPRGKEDMTKHTTYIRESFRHANDFYVYNYLLKPIRIEAVAKDGDKTVILEDRIPGKSKRGFRMATIEKYFTQNHSIRVFVHTKSDDGSDLLQPFGEYRFNTPEDTTIKALHVGMITSRWVGANSDYNIGKPGLNAVQGLPWIKIWNNTDFVLKLNNNINISPGGVLRYTGRDHFGVRLGTVFKDVDGVFPDFIWTIPATDVYYGITSDLQQSLFGGFQLTPVFHDDDMEPQYLLEEGWMYGEANGNIPFGYIPLEGPPVAPQDRWGRKITNSELADMKRFVGPPIEKDPPWE